MRTVRVTASPAGGTARSVAGRSAVLRWLREAALAGTLVVAVAIGLSACVGLGATPDQETPGILTPAPGATTVEPTATASPAPTPTPAATASGPSPSGPSRTPGGIAAAGCFGPSGSSPAPSPTALLPAKELSDRLPILNPTVSERLAYVGSSLTDGIASVYLDAFQSCTGADRAAMRFGWVQGGVTLGVIPMAVEIDGYTGWKLASIMIDGYAADPNLRSRLTLGEHDGWHYLYTDGLALTASSTTLYIMQTFCCADARDTTGLPTFQEIVNDYLDRTNDSPAPMPRD